MRPQVIGASTDTSLRGVAAAHGGEGAEHAVQTSGSGLADRAIHTRIAAMSLDTHQGGTVRVAHNADSPRDTPSSSQRGADGDGSGTPKGRLSRNTTLESARGDSEWPMTEVTAPEAAPSDEQWRPRRASDTKPRLRLEVQTGALKGRTVLFTDDTTQVSGPTLSLVLVQRG